MAGGGRAADDGAVRTPLPLPLAVPVAGTAVRPHWSDLPAGVRTRVERALGTEVVEALSQGSGFTPGFASRLRLADGRRVFVKAAEASQPWLLEAYREEAAKLALLPATVPAPRLQQLLDEPVAGTEWLVLVFDDVAGRPPRRPWHPDEARLALRTAADLAEALTPAPAGRIWSRLAEQGFAAAAERPELLVGDTLCHSDLRDDNLILDQGGTAWVCDWNWPTVGPRWTDAVCLAISMYGDGLPADALLAETGLVDPGDRAAVDVLLAALHAYFVEWAARPAKPTSPYLRAHQAWYARATGAWLEERRGWT